MQFRKLIVPVTVCVTAIAVASIHRDASTVRHHASLSTDLEAFQAAHSRKSVRVIAHGSDANLAAVATRHGVPVVRVLDHAAVLEATAAQIDALDRKSVV